MSEQELRAPDELYYMQAVGHCGNSLLWWKKGRCGYTCDIQQAHVFTRDEALRQHRTRPDVDFPWRKSYIDGLVQLHVNVETVSPKEGRLHEC